MALFLPRLTNDFKILELDIFFITIKARFYKLYNSIIKLKVISMTTIKLPLPQFENLEMKRAIIDHLRMLYLKFDRSKSKNTKQYNPFILELPKDNQHFETILNYWMDFNTDFESGNNSSYGSSVYTSEELLTTMRAMASANPGLSVAFEVAYSLFNNDEDDTMARMYSQLVSEVSQIIERALDERIMEGHITKLETAIDYLRDDYEDDLGDVPQLKETLALYRKDLNEILNSLDNERLFTQGLSIFIHTLIVLLEVQRLFTYNNKKLSPDETLAEILEELREKISDNLPPLIQKIHAFVYSQAFPLWENDEYIDMPPSNILFDTLGIVKSQYYQKIHIDKNIHGINPQFNDDTIYHYTKDLHAFEYNLGVVSQRGVHDPVCGHAVINHDILSNISELQRSYTICKSWHTYMKIENILSVSNSMASIMDANIAQINVEPYKLQNNQDLFFTKTEAAYVDKNLCIYFFSDDKVLQHQDGRTAGNATPLSVEKMYKFSIPTKKVNGITENQELRGTLGIDELSFCFIYENKGFVYEKGAMNKMAMQLDEKNTHYRPKALFNFKFDRCFWGPGYNLFFNGNKVFRWDLVLTEKRPQPPESDISKIFPTPDGLFDNGIDAGFFHFANNNVVLIKDGQFRVFNDKGDGYFGYILAYENQENQKLSLYKDVFKNTASEANYKRTMKSAKKN